MTPLLSGAMTRATTFAIGLLLYAVALPVRAATITVTNTNDSGPGSLRQALAVAHDGDRITLAVSGTITLTSGGLQVTKNVTISGPSANQLSIDGNLNQALFVFGVFPQRAVSISGLSIRNAQVGVYNNQGALSVSNCVLSGTSAGLDNDAGQGSGGASMTVANSTIKNAEVGISNNQGTVSVINCVLSGNSFAGLYNYAAGGSDGASMTVANSIISNNAGEGAINWLPSDGGGCACMTITDSVVSNNTEGIFNIGDAFPGAASLTVVNSNVSDNNNGGISNNANSGSGGSATATIVSSTVSGNSGGGVYISGGKGFAGVTITNSTISGNSTSGGIKAVSFFVLSAANLSVANSTISGNSAEDSGGGIYASALGDFSIVNSTITGNSGGTSGGGIYNFASSLNVANSTITGNSAGSGGGIYNDGQFGVSAVEISNTILNVGALGANIFNNLGTVTSHGYNLSSDDGGGYLTGPGDQINTDPLLGPLQNNGGPTFTHALLPGSPAIDAGDPNFTPPPFNDQRGCPFDRVFNGRIDIGSFETQPPPRRPCSTPRPRPTPVHRP
ncbi:MAG: choice-of-anchor Q domain-containing protein [Candidatus Udaeobacter sp.]